MQIEQVWDDILETKVSPDADVLAKALVYVVEALGELTAEAEAAVLAIKEQTQAIQAQTRLMTEAAEAMMTAMAEITVRLSGGTKHP